MCVERWVGLKDLYFYYVDLGRKMKQLLLKKNNFLIEILRLVCRLSFQIQLIKCNFMIYKINKINSTKIKSQNHFIQKLFIKPTISDGPTTYSIPQGDRKNSDLEFIDRTYDGKMVEKGVLKGGLGQLTDGITAPTNFRSDPDMTGHRGFDWVGWKNDSNRGPIQILFEFEGVRNFSTIRFHASNSFSKEVCVGI